MTRSMQFISYQIGGENQNWGLNKITAARGEENDEQSVIDNSCDSLKSLNSLKNWIRYKSLIEDSII